MTFRKYRVFVGGIGTGVEREDVEREFGKYGKLSSVWVAQNPPGFAFVEFDDGRDADEAVKKLNGQSVFDENKIRVEHSRERRGFSRGRGGGPPGSGGPPRGRGGFRGSFGYSSSRGGEGGRNPGSSSGGYRGFRGSSGGSSSGRPSYNPSYRDSGSSSSTNNGRGSSSRDSRGESRFERSKDSSSGSGSRYSSSSFSNRSRFQGGGSPRGRGRGGFSSYRSRSPMTQGSRRSYDGKSRDYSPPPHKSNSNSFHSPYQDSYSQGRSDY